MASRVGSWGDAREQRAFVEKRSAAEVIWGAVLGFLSVFCLVVSGRASLDGSQGTSKRVAKFA